MKHSISCTYPEGCTCGASRINRWTKLIRSQEQELATLRAKADAWDKGHECYGIFDESPQLVTISTHPQDNLINGYTCRKVRVCEVTAAGEKPALATKYKERLWIREKNC